RLSTHTTERRTRKRLPSTADAPARVPARRPRPDSCRSPRGSRSGSPSSFSRWLSFGGRHPICRVTFPFSFPTRRPLPSADLLTQARHARSRRQSHPGDSEEKRKSRCDASRPRNGYVPTYGGQKCPLGSTPIGAAPGARACDCPIVLLLSSVARCGARQLAGLHLTHRGR